MDGELHSLLVSGLTDVFRTVAICQAKLAAGTSIDGQGYLLQVHCICEELHPVLFLDHLYMLLSSVLQQDWRPCNSRTWLGEYLLRQPAKQLSDRNQSSSATVQSE